MGYGFEGFPCKFGIFILIWVMILKSEFCLSLCLCNETNMFFLRLLVITVNLGLPPSSGPNSFFTDHSCVQIWSEACFKF